MKWLLGCRVVGCMVGSGRAFDYISWALWANCCRAFVEERQLCVKGMSSWMLCAACCDRCAGRVTGTRGRQQASEPPLLVSQDGCCIFEGLTTGCISVSNCHAPQLRL